MNHPFLSTALSVGGTRVLHANLQVTSQSDFSAAGVTWEYRRNSTAETLSASGTLTQAADIEALVGLNGNSVRFTYEYIVANPTTQPTTTQPTTTRPTTTRPTTTPPTATQPTTTPPTTTRSTTTPPTTTQPTTTRPTTTRPTTTQPTTTPPTTTQPTTTSTKPPTPTPTSPPDSCPGMLRLIANLSHTNCMWQPLSPLKNCMHSYTSPPLQIHVRTSLVSAVFFQ